jgi:hypothetical protein
MTTAFWAEQGKHGFQFRCGTYAERGASKLAFPNIHSIEETLTDLGLYDVGGDGFEPPTLRCKRGAAQTSYLRKRALHERGW